MSNSGTGASLYPAWSNSNGSGAALLADAVHYYRMEENLANRVDVLGGTSWSGGTVPSGTGKNNNGAAVQVGQILSINTTNFFPTAEGSWTVTFWVRPNSFTDALIVDIPVVVSTTTAGGFDFVRGGNGDTTAYFRVYPTGGQTNISGNPLSTGSFHFVALWHNNSNGTCGMQIDTTTSATTSAGFSTSAGTNMFTSFTADTGINGIFDEMAVFNRALTGPERSLLYNAGAGLFL